MSKKKAVFPRTLYKLGGPEILYSAGEKFEYSAVLVESEEGMKTALAEGYVDDFHDALFGEPEQEPEIEEKEAPDLSFDDPDDF